MPEQAGHRIVRISQLRQQKPGLLLSCTKNRMLVANPIVCPGRRTKAIDSFLDRGTMVFIKIASVRNTLKK